MSLKAAMVLTTIADPALLEDYHASFLTHHHLEQIRIIVIPDRKTPPAIFERCVSLAKRGLSVACPSLQEQDSFLRKIGFAPELIPYDSDNRRNVGYLMALEESVDFLISIDDDNFSPSQEDFFGEHSVVCDDEKNTCVAETSGGWFNICSLMTVEPEFPVYPRGFPYYARHRRQEIREYPRDVIIRINAGLWLQEPDLDAMTWLCTPVRTTSFQGRSVVLGDRTWSPVNTQNTALHRTVIPSYYFLRMGYPLSGMRIDRYGDIFSGYFSQACARSLGHSVRIGTPIATHARNSHNYLRDAGQELACIGLLEDLLPWLQEQQLTGNNYAETYVSLSHALNEAVPHFKGFLWNEEARQFFNSTAHTMREWVKACRRLGI
jgi:hypothetical protein